MLYRLCAGTAPVLTAKLNTSLKSCQPWSSVLLPSTLGSAGCVSELLLYYSSQ